MDSTEKKTDYYHGDCSHRSLDPEHDAADAIACLVIQFVKRNRYEDHVSALMDVTPNQWIAQVNRAAAHLEMALTEVMEEHEDLIHMGEFAEEVVKK